MLRQYQKEGIDWLVKNDVGILADDMGLGKTVQTIKAMEYLFEKEIIKNCIIAYCHYKNWENEITKWAPNLKSRLKSSDSSNTAF